MLRAVNLVGNLFEEIGNLVKNGIVDEYLLLDEYVTQVIGMWNRLEPYTALTRDVTGDMGLWDNFEYLTVRRGSSSRRIRRPIPRACPASRSRTRGRGSICSDQFIRPPSWYRRSRRRYRNGFQRPAWNPLG